MPHFIVNVETTPATTPDDHMVKPVHASLEQRDLLPAEHLVDKGYTDSQVLVESQQTYAVTLIGPVADDPSLVKPAPVRASTNRTFSLIGIARLSSARWAKRASPGSQTPTPRTA